MTYSVFLLGHKGTAPLTACKVLAFVIIIIAFFNAV